LPITGSELRSNAPGQIVADIARHESPRSSLRKIFCAEKYSRSGRDG